MERQRDLAELLRDPGRMYGDESVFREECEGLFAHNWIFAGLATDIPASNDFFRVPMFNRDVVVQNFHGEPHAFINSCSHRHSQIQHEIRGNRPLVCPYHGWAYDKRGVPTGIPRREEFPEVCANPEAYRLHSVDLERAGNFLFLRLGGDGADLREFLGEAHGFLESVSEGMDRSLDEVEASVGANWKLVIENSLEGYHVPLVHRNSLAAIAQLTGAKLK